MKRTALRSRKLPELPLDWNEAEYAALRADAADTSEDRESQNMLDIEDERVEVDSIAHSVVHGAN